MTLPPEYEQLPNGTLKRVDGAITRYDEPYWGHEGRSTIQDQLFNCHGFKGENGKTKAETLLEWCIGHKLLEIGCAPGAFLKLATDAGFNCTGIEPCAEHVPFIRDHSGCTVANLHFEDYYAAPEWDSIVFADVLEHVQDPFAFIEKALFLLRPLGRLIIMIPAIMKDGVFREQDLCPEHLWLFSERHLNEWLHPIHMSRWYPGHILVVVEKGVKE